MRNIKVVNEALSQLNLDSSSIIASIFDSAEKQLIVLCSDSVILRISIDLTTNEFFTEVKWDLTKNFLELEVKVEDISGMTLQKFNEHLFLATHSRIFRLELEKVKTVHLSEVFSLAFGDADSILACESSPDEELFALVTTKQVFLMNRLFKPKLKRELVAQPGSLLSAVVVWRFDSMFFQINMEVGTGRKVLTFDKGLEPEQSPSKYDPAYTLVRNVFENPRRKLSGITSWTPGGGLTYGVIQQTITATGSSHGKGPANSSIRRQNYSRKNCFMGEKWVVPLSVLFADGHHEHCRPQ